MTVSDITSLVTAMVAVVALLLSLYNFYVDRRDKATQLKVRLSNGFLTYGPEISEVMLFLEIANVGQSRAVINSARLKWQDHNLEFISGIEGTKKLPFELQPGDGARFWTPKERVESVLREHGARGSVKIRASFTDAAGNDYHSPKWSVALAQ